MEFMKQFKIDQKSKYNNQLFVEYVTESLLLLKFL